MFNSVLSTRKKWEQYKGERRDLWKCILGNETWDGKVSSDFVWILSRIACAFSTFSRCKKKRRKSSSVSISSFPGALSLLAIVIDTVAMCFFPSKAVNEVSTRTRVSPTPIRFIHTFNSACNRVDMPFVSCQHRRKCATHHRFFPMVSLEVETPMQSHIVLWSNFSKMSKRSNSNFYS